MVDTVLRAVTVLAICCWCFVIANDLLDTGPVVTTQYGKIRGSLRYATASKRPVYSYFGVKYGRTPDYFFRFQPPENPWNWSDIRNATDESRPMCVQDIDRYHSLRKHTFLKHMMPSDPNMSEDCLLLDVFTPVSPESKSKTSLPVIVWIHGGSFDAFCSTTKLWALSAFEAVVLVQVQYRLGLFGFFTTNDEWATANNAFHDQIKALKWVQTNIHAFGGDPASVTLMGESAGSIAATAHMLMPKSVGLFHRVIGLSGAPDTMNWRESYLDTARRLGKHASCDFESIGAVDICIQNKLGTSTLMRMAKQTGAEFSLSEDPTLFPDKIQTLIDKALFVSRVPVLMGVTSGEADYLLSRKVFADVYKKGPNSTTQELQQAMVHLLYSLYPDSKTDEMAEMVFKRYTNESNCDSSETRFRVFLQAFADSYFTSKAARFAKKVEESGGRAYFLEFDMKPSMYDAMPEQYPRQYNFRSADHADDIPYVFGFPFVTEYTGGENPAMSFTKTEEEISRKYMHLIAHFAKVGFPEKELNWLRYPNYLRVGDSFKAQPTAYSEDKMRFWNEEIKKMASA